MSYSWGNDTSSSWKGSKKGFNWGSTYSAYDKDKAYVSKKKPAKKTTLKDMEKSYKLSAKVIKTDLPQQDAELLEKMKAKDIIITPGQYDSVQDVLRKAEIPHTMAGSGSRTQSLSADQIVLVNCPGNSLPISFKNKKGVEALRAFVAAGGFLVTTDWALENVIMRGFEGFAARGAKDTQGNDHVEIDLVAEGSPYTRGLGSGSLKPMWWLEPSSYPIRLLRKKETDVLLSSEEMRKRYKHAPIAIKFGVEEGRVIHVTSHFKLQSGQVKYEAQADKTGEDFASSFLGMSKGAINNIPDLKSVNFGAMEAAYFSLRFLQNIFLQKLRNNAGIDAHETTNPKLLTADKKSLGKLTGKSLRKLPMKSKQNKGLV